MGKGDFRRPVDRTLFESGFDRIFDPSKKTKRPDEGWIQTYTGKRFWPLKARAEDLDIVDVAHALSNVCRYGGHVRSFYSVAQHSVQVSYNVPEKHALYGLLHDAAEAYLGDMVNPLKRNPIWAFQFRKAEAKLMLKVEERFGLPRGVPIEVEWADHLLLITEIRDLMFDPHLYRYTRDQRLALPDRITPLSSLAAEELFLERFLSLGGVK